MMTNYVVRQHDDHFHVIANGDRTLDCRHTNPWWYDDELLADQVARLLNSGMAPHWIKDMEYQQISAAARHVR
jgi:hypothetical protein